MQPQDTIKFEGVEEPSERLGATEDHSPELDSSKEYHDYPTGIRLGLICLSLCLSIFLTALDNTIIATAIPKITDQFQSQGDIGWYGSAYLLTQASLQLLFGKAYTYGSIKWIFLMAIALFELGSLVCGVAPNSTALICGRAIAGLGAAGISNGAMIIVTYSVPLVKRPMYTGLIGAMYGIASVVGPILGGVFTDKVTWRWCFYINLPIGGVAVMLIVIFFTAPQRSAITDMSWGDRLKQFDFLGSLVFMPAVICVLLALQWGGTSYPWSNWRNILLLVLFGVLVLCWLLLQYFKGDSATVPPRLVAQRSVAAALWFNFCMGSFFLILVYYVPIWFQAVKDQSAMGSGIRTLPFILGLVLVSIIAGIGVTIVGYYAPFMIASSIVSSIGAGLLMTFRPSTGHAHWIGYQAIVGIGVGLGLQQPLVVCQTVLSLDDVPTGTAMMYFVQTFGGALFIAVAQNVFQNRLKEELIKTVPDVDPNVVVSTGATSLQGSVSAQDLPRVLSAYNAGLTRAFLVATIMAALTLIGSLAVQWRTIKSTKSEANKPNTDLNESVDKDATTAAVGDAP
ncbi:DHA14-like major facilitator [Aspergillus uvarum CBS 121591]|uniref:DHA14-like major facilitator n=1 Tax=Aspergillus uvarum CBS 121591 TaxID=1448315 RepID=A0A319C7T8_9EURO|nr:DHA14-like major facilitator [Aspergillus uvarum CBS 121591]PYH81304.1 DHA14-like major facilitator [Aspergillus uvarum CBS 121591]